MMPVDLGGGGRINSFLPFLVDNYLVINFFGWSPGGGVSMSRIVFIPVKFFMQSSNWIL